MVECAAAWHAELDGINHNHGGGEVENVQNQPTNQAFSSPPFAAPRASGTKCRRTATQIRNMLKKSLKQEKLEGRG